MGIQLSRNIGEKSLAKNFNATYFHTKDSMSQLLDKNGSEDGVVDGNKKWFTFQLHKYMI